MAAHLLRVFVATIASMALAIILTLGVLSTVAPPGADPLEASQIALAQAFADTAPDIVPTILSMGAVVAALSLLFPLGLGAAAIWARCRARGASPRATEGRERK